MANFNAEVIQSVSEGAKEAFVTAKGVFTAFRDAHGMMGENAAADRFAEVMKPYERTFNETVKDLVKNAMTQIGTYVGNLEAFENVVKGIEDLDAGALNNLDRNAQVPAFDM